jgi:hypothetical protein
MVTDHADTCMAPLPCFQDDTGVFLRRWLMLGAAGLALVVLALMHGASVGAQSGYPANTVVSTYVDPRYCDGLVSVVTDQYGNLIDVCTTTGQRIYPVYLDYGYATPGYAAPAYVNGNAFYNGFNNGLYNYPAYLGANNVCPSGNFSCYAAYPFAGYAGYTGYTGYAFPYGYTGTYSGQTTIVVPSKNITVVGPPVYVKEVAPPAATTVTAAPPAAPASAPVQVAPTAGMATAMNAPAAAPASGAGVVTAYSAPPATAPGVQIDPSDQR